MQWLCGQRQLFTWFVVAGVVLQSDDFSVPPKPQIEAPLPSIEEMSQAFARQSARAKAQAQAEAKAAEEAVTIPEQHVERLERINRWPTLSEEELNGIRSGSEEWKVIAQGPSDKDQRAKLHVLIKKRFPFLNTSTRRVDDEFVITIEPDLTFAELKPLLSMEDFTSLYEFRNTCTDPDGQVIIGRGMDRETRTEVFRRMTAADKSLDSKTIDVPDGKAMAVCWRKKAQSRKRQLSSEQVHGPGGRTAAVPQAETPMYLWFVLKKENMEQLAAIQKLAEMLHISPAEFHSAGIKDKRAVTFQYVSVRGDMSERSISSKAYRKQGVTPYQLLDCNGREPALTVSNLAWKERPITVGQLQGNFFRVVVRGIRSSGAGEDVVSISQHRAATIVQHGFPNIFGPQRMGTSAEDLDAESGEVQCAGYLVGHRLLLEDYKGAVDVMMAPRAGETDEMAEAKELYQTGAAHKEVLRALPRGATKERMIFKGLDRYGKDFKRAFEQIPHSYRTFWIHAFQSHIWNACAMFRLQQFGPKPVVGDLYLDPSGSGSAPRVLQAEDIPSHDDDDARSMMQRIVLPLGGRSVLLPVNDVGQRYVNLLAEYGLRIPFVNVDQFAAPDAADALTTVPDSVLPRGAYRTLLSFPEILHAQVIGESEDGIDAELTFKLQAGSYATSLLREAFCNNDIWLAEHTTFADET